MIDQLVARVPVEYRLDAAKLLLVLVVFTAGFLLNFAWRTHVIQKTVRVEKSWGAPSQSLPGDAVNPNLAGLTCDVYGGRRTVVCHP